MEIYLIIVICVLILVILCLAARIICMHRSLDKMADVLGDIIGADTNAVITVDTSDRHIRHLASQLNRELRRLRSARLRYEHGNNELNNAIVSISHDLRTPVTAIAGYLDLLDDEEVSDDVRKYLSVIRERVEAVRSLAGELFKYSVVMSSEDDFKPETVVLNSELEQAAAVMYAAFAEKGIEPVIIIPEEKVIRNTDRNSVRRIFSNMLSNALKYSQGDLKIELRTNGEILFANKTDMLDATDVGRLFDRFFTVENARNSTGLGLSIARTLAERCGGTVDAELRGGNIVFRVKL